MAYLNMIDTVVEAPFLSVEISGYTFGMVSKQGKNGSFPAKIQFPNFVKSISIKKVNGEVNTYTVHLEYVITPGEDPNFIDKIFSMASADRNMTISYGDWSAPSHIYKNETALITNVTSSVEITQSKITYTITGISNCVSLISQKHYFSSKSAKPSAELLRLIKSSRYGITESFKGLSNLQKVLSSGLIATNDAVVQLDQQTCSTWEYVKYLVNCMRPEGSSSGNATDSYYALSVIDDNKNMLGGSYFTVTEISKSAQTSTSNSSYQPYSDAYEMDIGFMDFTSGSIHNSSNLVTSFTVDQNDQWTILYNLSQSSVPQPTFSLNSSGEVTKTPLNSLLKDSTKNKIESDNTTWWSAVTEFPIKATLTLKGLVRPTILMSYIKLNVLFYGQKHISSGTYIITGETDEISGTGYKTTLNLTRIKGE